jgi:hypothetical protein
LLEDDPSFMPSLGLELIDLDIFDLEGSFSQEQQIHSSSSISLYSSLDDHSEGGPVGGIVIPSESSSVMGPAGSFTMRGDDGRGASASRELERLAEQDEQEDLQFDVGFSFDEFGNLHNTPNPMRPPAAADQQLALGSETGLSERVRREHQDGQVQGVNVRNLTVHYFNPFLSRLFSLLKTKNSLIFDSRVNSWTSTCPSLMVI